MKSNSAEYSVDNKPGLFEGITADKVNVHPRIYHEGPEEDQRNRFILSLTSAHDGGGWLTPRPGRFTPGNEPVPNVQDAG